MKSLFSILSVLSILLFSSCAKEYAPDEILNTSKYDNIYTACTLWYTNPLEMTSANIQQGSILPFGSEVVITKVTDEEVCFDAAGKNFRITLEDKNLETVQAFVKRIFSRKNADDLAGKYSAADYEKMKRGVVSEGMTEEQVLVAYGRPSLSRTPYLTNDTWIYQAEKVKSRRVIFKQEKKNSPRTVLRVFEL